MNLYLTFKALHVISFLAWSAGLFYLPRLFVYHCEVNFKTEAYERFSLMELRLLRIIMNPAMIATWIFGILIIVSGGHEIAQQFWFKIKFVLVILMSGFHGYLASCRKKFLDGSNVKSAKFYRIINEIPTVLIIIIVFLAIFKPQ
jgi:putative membrane protein